MSESETSTFSPKRSSGATSAQRPAWPLRRISCPEPQNTPLLAAEMAAACTGGSTSTTPTRPDKPIECSCFAQLAAYFEDPALVNVTNNVSNWVCASTRACVSGCSLESHDWACQRLGVDRGLAVRGMRGRAATGSRAYSYSRTRRREPIRFRVRLW